jgi:prepilin-type N-terminal cleavage/methylation domain-containing protein
MINQVLPRRGVRLDELRYNAFTLIELIVVVGIITVLTGLVLTTVGYARKKGAMARAETEIAALSAACENYKADNGIYPRGQSTSVPASGTPTYTVATSGTDDLNARINTDSTQKIYQDACRYLYEQLSGDVNLDLVVDSGKKSYFSFKESMLATIKDVNGNTVGLSHIKDPFGNSYGYSTANQADPVTPKGYNPTFDLWSTAGGTTTGDTPQWIKNW